MLVSISLSSNIIREKEINTTEALHRPAFLLFQSSLIRLFRNWATSMVKSTLCSYWCNAFTMQVVNVPVPLTPAVVVLRCHHQKLIRAIPYCQLVPRILHPKQQHLGTSHGE